MEKKNQTGVGEAAAGTITNKQTADARTADDQEKIDNGKNSDASTLPVENAEKEPTGKAGESTQVLEVQDQQKSDEKDNNSRTINISNQAKVHALINESQKDPQAPSQSINDLKEREREPLKVSAKENAAAATQKQGGGGGGQGMVQQQPP